MQGVASNASYNGVTGPDQTFVAGAPDVTTAAASLVERLQLPSETVNGTINPGGTDTTWYFQYGLAGNVQSQVVPAVGPALTLASLPSVGFDGSTAPADPDGRRRIDRRLPVGAGDAHRARPRHL